MGIWSLMTTAAAASLQWRRRTGILELLVAARQPFWAILAPITIAISARELVAGGTFSDVVPLLATELLVGLVYATIGLFLVQLFEVQARRGAALELA